MADDGQRDHRAQDRRDEAARHRDQEAVAGRAQQGVGLAELLVPVEGEAAERKRQRRVGLEGEREQDRDREVQQDDHGPEVDRQVARPAPGQGPPRPGAPARGPAPALDGNAGAHGRMNRSTRTSRIAIRTRMTVEISMIIDRAEPSGQLAALVKKSWMMLPYIDPLLPPTSKGVMYSPIVGMNTRKNAAATPGMLSGRVTRRNWPAGLAPRSAAASSSSGRTRDRAARIGSTANGIHT